MSQGPWQGSKKGVEEVAAMDRFYSMYCSCNTSSHRRGSSHVTSLKHRAAVLFHCSFFFVQIRMAEFGLPAFA